MFVGADAAALDGAAARLDAAADEIQRHGGALGGALSALSWLGRFASAFTERFTGLHRPQMLSTADFLRHAANELRTHAREQRDASAPESAAAIAARAARERAQAQARIAAALDADLVRIRSASATEQAEWWNSLTDEQRAALLTARSGELTALGGLPPEVLITAREIAFSKAASDVAVLTESISGEVKASVRFVKAGVGYEAERVEYADGSVDLTLELWAAAGVSAEIASLLATGGNGITYRFASAKEADDFLAGLQREIVPGWKEALFSGNVAADAAKDAYAYLAKHSDHVKSISMEHGVEADVDIPGVAGAGFALNGKVSVDGPAGDRGTVTVEAKGSVSGSVTPGMTKVGGEAEVSASATVRGGAMTSITLRSDLQSSALAGMFTAAGEIGAGAGTGSTIEATFDLTDPRVASATAEASSAMKRGDVNGAYQALAKVADRATVVVQTTNDVSAVAGFDAKVVSGKVETRAATENVTYFRPPGGGMYEVLK